MSVTSTSFIQFAEAPLLPGRPILDDCRQFADFSWATAIEAAKTISHRGRHGDREVRQAWLNIIQALVVDDGGTIPNFGLLWGYFERFYDNFLLPVGNTTEFSPLDLDMVFQAFETPAKAAAAFLADTTEDLKSQEFHELAFEDIMGDPWRIRHAHRERDKRIRVIARAAMRGSEPDLFI